MEGDLGNRWYVVETKWAAEAQAAENLVSQGFRTLYPEILVKRKVRGKEIEVCRPLFGGYVFVEFDREAEGSGWKSIHSTRGVQRLFGGNDPAPLPHGEAEFLLARCEAGPVVEDEFAGLVLGKWVRGAAGWVEGMSVKVVRFSALGRVGVLMAIMGRECLVTVPKEWLEVVR